MSEEKKHMLNTLNLNLRYDGRKLEDYRPISVELDCVRNAEGSARVKIGNTEVIAGVKLSIEKPFPDTADEGMLMVGAELLPMSNPDFELGPPGIQAIELARVVDRAIRESKVVDLKQLCITKGEKVWGVNIDIVSINDEGNLFDASALAATAALKSTRFPGYNGEKIDYHVRTEKKLPVRKLPISVTVVKIGDKTLIDPTIEEEQMVDSRLTVATTEDNVICAMQKGGQTPMTQKDVESMIELATKKAGELRKYF